ncbi:MAG: 2-oxoacid:acceptor oxidoreductase subunit alpha [Candidatus Aenigmarchaeota archaeon]|nr:2-oxoacid:acceptor oxidoreductase subunit alpha [Candidatus Aenigmarchaeota archaeon]
MPLSLQPRVVNSLSWKVAGAAGHGILNAGLSLFGKACQRGGLQVMATAEYPSLIRGGHNHLDVRVADRHLQAHTKYITLLLALNKDSLDKHVRKIVPGGGVIYDADEIPDPQITRKDIAVIGVPLKKLALEAGHEIMRNTVGIGASFALLDCGLGPLQGVIQDNFGRKGEAIVAGNQKAAQLGHDYVKVHHQDIFPFQLRFKPPQGALFLSGHEALATGAIKAGCKFYAAYPMTPASSLLHVFAKHEREYGIVVKHTEDEIAAVNMAIGASYAGARAMTGTSGGGFALMVEGLGLAAQTEVPLVVVESQRPGPATGMATHSGQGDLRFVLHASTDEFPRIVLAPGDVQECFAFGALAFNLAEKYQLPVIILTDKYLGESYWTVPGLPPAPAVDRGMLLNNGHGLDLPYRRYQNTPSGVSPRAVPGVKGGTHVASSYEHDEEGFEREEEEIRVMMHQKRFRKLAAALLDLPQPQLLGPAQAEVTFVAWGSSKGPVQEAIRILGQEGYACNLLQIPCLNPFPAAFVQQVLAGARKPVIVEGNMTSQLNSLIREHCLRDVPDKILKYDGRPFHPEDIADEVRKLVPKKGYAVKAGAW